MALTRDQLLSRLRADLQPLDHVLALAVAGSDAFGEADALSDLDLVVHVEKGRAEDALAVVEASVRAFGPPAARWRVPDPTWHGNVQCFWRPAGAPETLLVDVTFLERGAPGLRFDERETHGEPVVIFDKAGVARSIPLDACDNDRRMRARRDVIRARTALFAGFPAKELARGRALDAWAFHDTMLLQPLVELLRMRHCPERFAFARRYLRRDLPEETVQRLERLHFVPSPALLRDRIDEARGWLEAELASWDA